MNKKYKLILAALKKGKAVVIDVKSSSEREDRTRVVTPNDCEFIFEIADYFWGQSCFLYAVVDRNPETIVNAMQAYDKKFNLTLKRIEVLK